MGSALTFSQLRALCPGRWEELTAGQFERIYSEWGLEKPAHERDYLKLLSILTNKTFDFVPSPEQEEAIYQLVRWVIETPVPFKIGTGQDVHELSIGKNILVQQILNKSKYLESCICSAVAIYEDKEVEEIRLKPVGEVYPLGFFLLNRAYRRGLRRRMNWPRILYSPILRLKRMFLP